MTTIRRAIGSASTVEFLVLWINRGLEFLWLLAVVLVPLAFLDRDYVLSQSSFYYLQVPKIALLRTLVGMIAILWLIEGALRGSWFPFASFFKGEGSLLRPTAWLVGMIAWLRGQPTRWMTFAVVLYLGTTLLSTVLSPSFSRSMWGATPGQDGFPAYTIIAYVVLFGVIATHLKTRPQLWRVLGAIVVMGVLVAGYGVLQHFGHDFFELLEPPGTTRAASTMGNPNIAGAVMLMTIIVTLMVATVVIREHVWSARFWTNVVIWGLVLTIQLLGLIFTLEVTSIGV